MADCVCEFQLDKTFKYPKLYPNEEEVFLQRIRDNYKDKLAKGIITNDKRYAEHIQEEIRVLKKNWYGWLYAFYV